MKIDFMRIIDYWVGRALCYVLTIWDIIFGFRKSSNSIPRKILFIKLSEMGGTILAYPFIKKVNSEFTNAEMFFVVFDKNKFIFDVLDIIPSDNILTIRDESFYKFTIDTLRAITRIRRERIDIVFDLELFSRFSAILTYLSGGCKRIGFYKYSFEGLYRGNLLTHRVQYNPLLHIGKIFLSLLQMVTKKNKFTPELEKEIKDTELILPRYISSDQEKKKMRDRLNSYQISEEHRLFIIGPGDGMLPLREWPMDNFIALSKMILNDDRNVVIIVGSGDIERAERLYNALDNKRCLNFHNKTTMAELLTLFDIGDILLCNDSGLSHISSLTKIKKIVFFGPESPQIYAPLGNNTVVLYSNLPCSPCFSALNHRRSECKNNMCLKVIRPEEVFRLL